MGITWIRKNCESEQALQQFSTVHPPHRNFVDYIKLCAAVNTTEERDAIQRDLGKLEKWMDRKQKQFNKIKCKVLYLARQSYIRVQTGRRTH